MGRRLRQLALLTLVLGGLGCQHGKTSMLQPKPSPPDPLLITKKPVEGRPRGADPLLIPEPQAPRDPVVRKDHSMSRPVRTTYRTPDDTGVSIGRPTTLP